MRLFLVLAVAIGALLAMAGAAPASESAQLLRAHPTRTRTPTPTSTQTPAATATPGPSATPVGPLPDGSLTRAAVAPILPANGEYLGLAVSVSHYAAVGPVAIAKIGATEYRAWAELVAAQAFVGGQQTYGQAGTYDADTTTGYLTSADGTNWTWRDQDANGDPDRLLTPDTPTNPVGGSTVWMHGEASVGTVLWDPDAAVWKLWGHGGNNSGPRALYYATSSDGLSWTLQNNGQPVLQRGNAGAFDESWVADARVIRLSASSYVMLYRGTRSSGGPQIGRATSADGIAWTKDASNPVIALGPAGAWDDTSIYPGGILAPPTGPWHLWYGGDPDGDVGGTALGYAWSVDQGHTWTKGTHNPVLTLSAAGLDSVTIGGVIWAYTDAGTARIQYHSEKDVPNGGAGYFRGKLEASIVLP